MCNEQEIFNVDFSTVNDEFNWLGKHITTGIQTVGGKLHLKPDNTNSRFIRQIGSIDGNKNRIRLTSNFVINVPGSDPSVHIWFGIFVGNTQIDEFSVYEENLSSGDNVYFNLDRIYEYSGLSGNIELQVRFTRGFQSQIFLEDLEVVNFDFCETNIRTYFVVDNLLEDAWNSVSSALKLQEWKVDGIETLTPAFFVENNNPGGNPQSDWFFAKADIDGSNRVVDWNEPNSFNPYVSEWGLKFDTVNSYHGGKTTGTISGSDYGNGIMEIGFDKPEVFNGALTSKNGAFFIDIDYSKDLRIVFDVIVNDKSNNVFDGPRMNRRYYILWNKKTCQKEFYYTSLLPQLSAQFEVFQPVNVFQSAKKQLQPRTHQDGFLFGLTGGIVENTTVACDESFRFEGSSGVYEFVMSFGTGVGQAGINYNAHNVPDKFEIEWNGQIFSSGYVGHSFNDPKLIALGIPKSEINTGNPGTGNGTLYFNKNQPNPSTAIIRVTGPLPATMWDVQGVCPQIERFAEIKWEDTD